MSRDRVTVQFRVAAKDFSPVGYMEMIVGLLAMTGMISTGASWSKRTEKGIRYVYILVRLAPPPLADIGDDDLLDFDDDEEWK